MKKLAVRFDTLAQNYPSENVYIQTSKGIYETSEDLWFKAYLLNTHSFAPSALSRTLYLQLINEKTRQAVWQEKYEALNGFADGHVYLNDTLPDGDYLLAAYTSHSFFRDSTEMTAVRRIKVRKDIKVSYARREIAGTAAQHPKVTIQFNTFPEGGNLVSGIQSRLAFKAVNTAGKPVDIQGTLFEDTVPLATFQSDHAGMGKLEFIPITGKKYHIKLSSPATDSVFLLPEIYSKGITLRLARRDKDFLYFIVSQSHDAGKRTVYLRGQMRGVVYCMATGELTTGLNFKIPMKEFLSQGIAEFTLFDTNLKPVAERLVYVNPDRKLHIETQLNKERYEIREKATLKISVTDQNGQPVIASLGVSVFDKLYRDSTNAKNILTHYYLSSQLRGNIYGPAYYFDDKNNDCEEAMDLLMLTQGWSRYVWNETALRESVNANQPVVLDGMEGEVHATEKLKKAKGMPQFVKAFCPDKNKSTDMIIADSLGKFTVTPLHLKSGQGNYVYLKPMAPAEFEPRISLSDPFQTINEIRNTKTINYPLPAIEKKKKEAPLTLLAEGQHTIKLSEVTVKAYGITTFRDKYLGHLDSLAKFNSTSDYVCYQCGGNSSERILNCKFHTTDQSHKPEEGKKYVIRFGENLETHRYSSEKKISYHYPNFTEEELLKMNNLSRVKAYYPHREFYQPKYDQETFVDPTSDFRNTLYWEPSVITNEKGEATVEFYCSDINTHFVGNIEGVSGEGLLGKRDFEFYVRKVSSLNDEKTNTKP